MAVDDGGRAEELAFGPPGDQRQVRRWPALVLPLAIVVGVALAVLDSWLRDREAEELLAAVQRSQSVVAQADGDLSATVAYCSPALVLASTPAEVRRDLANFVADSAGEGAMSVRAARVQVEATDALPWHDDLERARTAYLDYLDGRGSQLEAVAEDVWTLFDPDERSAALLAAARDALRSVVSPDAAGQVDDLLAH